MTATLYVWRRQRQRLDRPAAAPADQCRYCGTLVVRGNWSEGGYSTYEWRCPLCGWWTRAQDASTGMYSDYRHGVLTSSNHSIEAVLESFDVSSSEIALSELGSHLKRQFSDVQNLSWRRFEELMADVFARHGYRVRLTQPSNDDGADIVVLQSDTDGHVEIIECKKYSRQNRIGVELVRQLVGAALLWRVKRAKLVTTSDFTAGARDATKRLRDRGYAIDLVAASDVLRLLGVYNESLPRLELLSLTDKRDIVQANCASIRDEYQMRSRRLW